MGVTNADLEIDFNVSRQWIMASLFFSFAILFSAIKNVTDNFFLAVILLMLSACFFYTFYRYYSNPIISISAGIITIRDIFTKTELNLADAKLGNGNWFAGIHVSDKSKEAVLPTKTISHSNYRKLLKLISKK